MSRLTLTVLTALRVDLLPQLFFGLLEFGCKRFAEVRSLEEGANFDF